MANKNGSGRWQNNGTKVDMGVPDTTTPFNQIPACGVVPF